MRTNAAYTAHRYIRDDAAFQRYLDVVNQTLAEVGERFPYHALLGQFAKALDGQPLVVSITDGTTQGETSVACVLDGLEFRVAPLPEALDAKRWRIDREHIDAVVAEPWRYLADPSRLELPPFNLVDIPAPAPARARRRHAHASRP